MPTTVPEAPDLLRAPRVEKVDATTVTVAASLLRTGDRPDTVAEFLARHVRIWEASS